jgi:hypothetical protein
VTVNTMTVRPTRRLESETQTTVEILDTTAQKHIFQRKNIASLSVSPNSIMPTGFESLPAEDLKALLEYLADIAATPDPLAMKAVLTGLNPGLLGRFLAARYNLAE